MDNRCGYCRKVAPTLSKLAQANDVKLIFKELPILGEQSVVAARAALAAHKQGAYLQAHEALLASVEPITLEWAEKLAVKLHLDVAKFKTDMESAETTIALQRNQLLADAIGVRATPSFVAGSELVSGALDMAALQSLISSAHRTTQASVR